MSSTGTLPLSPWPRALLWGFICPFAMDFKGGFVGGTLFQYVLLAITLVCGGLFIIQPKERRGSRALQVFSIAYWFILGLGCVATLIGKSQNLTDASVDTFSRAILPYVLGGLALMVVQALVKMRASINECILPILVVGLVSGVFRYAYTRYAVHADVGELRYQIISPAMMLVIPLCLTNILFHHRINRFALLLALGGMLEFFLSVTRTYILVAAVMLVTIPFFILLVRKPLRGLMLKRMLLAAAMLVPIGLVTLGLGLAIRPGLLDTWSTRLSQSERTRAADPSLIARQSAASGIWKTIHRDPFTLAFGKGFGGSTLYDPRYAPEYTRIVRIFPTSPTYAGMDSFFMTTLLFSGMVLGACFLGLCAWATLAAYHAVKRQAMNPLGLGGWAAFPLVTIVAQAPICYLANPMGERLTGLLLGITWGLAIVIGSLPIEELADDEDPAQERRRLIRQRRRGWQAAL